MKKRGFTLIELLAVIVILAIIALIATPMILGVIEDARKGSAKSSALGYVDAVEKSSLVYAVNNGTSFKDGEYKIQGKNLIQNDNVIYTVDYKGDEATGTIKISNGEVIEAKLIFKTIIDKKIIITDNKVTIGEEVEKEPEDEPNDTNKDPEIYGVTRELPTNGETYKAIVYLDPTDLKKECNAELASLNSTTGTKTGCMKFYAFAETNETYNLILDHNTTPLVAWNSSGKIADGMNEVKTALESDTVGWDANLNPRLITANEIAILTGADIALKWDSSKIYGTDNIEKKVSWFYLDGTGITYSSTNGWQKQIAKSRGASKYSWLYDNTYGCTSYGCNISDDNKYEYWTKESTNSIAGYWTSSPVVGLYRYAWYVRRDGYLNYSDIDYEYVNGVRPVITIEKSIFTE